MLLKEHGDGADPRPTVARRVLGLTRAAFGAGLIAAPGPIGSLWFGIEPGPVGRAALRGLGARDVAIGLGVGLAPTAAAGRWLQYSVIADVTDAAAAVAARRHLPSRNVVAASLSALGVAGVSLALQRTHG